METVERKNFASVAEAVVAQRVEDFIGKQANGAGHWPDQSSVSVPVVKGATLRIADKVGTDRGGPLRHIEVRQNGRLIVTLEYSHFTRQLIRTF